jgi:hypothetical protein
LKYNDPNGYQTNSLTISINIVAAVGFPIFFEVTWDDRGHANCGFNLTIALGAEVSSAVEFSHTSAKTIDDLDDSISKGGSFPIKDLGYGFSWDIGGGEVYSKGERYEEYHISIGANLPYIPFSYKESITLQGAKNALENLKDAYLFDLGITDDLIFKAGDKVIELNPTWNKETSESEYTDTWGKETWNN